MKFQQRLAYYLLGLMIGCFAVFYFLQQKDTTFCYLPNCRVIKDLRNKPLIFSDEIKEMLDNKTITLDEVKEYLTNGDVDFSKSNTNEKGGKLYVIETIDKNKTPIVIEMINYDNRALLKSIK
nr:DUF4258 domain-containing protein [uncultured Flavobacterium sp.]